MSTNTYQLLQTQSLVENSVEPNEVISPLHLLKNKIFLNLKIVAQMSEWSQMTELDSLSKSETPNLATLHRLACTVSYNSIKSDSLPKKVASRRNSLNYKVLYRPNGEE